MPEYISREAAIEALSHGDGCGHVCRHSIERIPAADVVEVVRCGECQHYNAGFECLIEGYGIERPADYFCADGKRKDGGQDDV